VCMCRAEGARSKRDSMVYSHCGERPVRMVNGGIREGVDLARRV